MPDHEKNVRDAAVALKGAIEAAERDGYRIVLPGLVADLDKVAISESGRVNPTATTPVNPGQQPTTSRPATLSRPPVPPAEPKKND